MVALTKDAIQEIKDRGELEGLIKAYKESLQAANSSITAAFNSKVGEMNWQKDSEYFRMYMDRADHAILRARQLYDCASEAQAKIIGRWGSTED